MTCVDTSVIVSAYGEDLITDQARLFFSFDTGSFQRVLAHSQKLSVWPPLTAAEQKHEASQVTIH